MGTPRIKLGAAGSYPSAVRNVFKLFLGGNQENLVFPPNFENVLKMFMNGVSGIDCC